MKENERKLLMALLCTICTTERDFCIVFLWCHLVLHQTHGGIPDESKLSPSPEQMEFCTNFLIEWNFVGISFGGLLARIAKYLLNGSLREVKFHTPNIAVAIIFFVAAATAAATIIVVAIIFAVTVAVSVTQGQCPQPTH
jgi:hypothetical protein